MKRFFLPTDFTELANSTLLEAAHLAKQFGAELIVANTYHRPSNAKGAGVLEAMEASLKKKFKALVAYHEILQELQLSFMTKLGFVKEEIPKMIAENNIDLVIMSTKGAKGVDQLWGSKTAEIVKEVNTPVIVMPPKATLQGLDKACLVCDYNNRINYNLLDTFVQFSDHLGINVDVVTINKGSGSLSEEESAIRLVVQNKLKDIKATYNYTYHNDVDSGIIAYAKANKLGLVGIIPTDYNFIERLFSDSLTEKMLYRSPIPLFILKS